MVFKLILSWFHQQKSPRKMDFSVLTEEPGLGFHLIHLLKPVFSLLLIKDVCAELAPKICPPMCIKNCDQSNSIGLKLSKQSREFMSNKAPCVWIKCLLEWRRRAGRGLGPLRAVHSGWWGRQRCGKHAPIWNFSSVDIPAFFYNIEHLFVNTKTLRTLTFKVEERIFWCNYVNCLHHLEKWGGN